MITCTRLRDDTTSATAGSLNKRFLIRRLDLELGLDLLFRLLHLAIVETGWSSEVVDESSLGGLQEGVVGMDGLVVVLVCWRAAGRELGGASRGESLGEEGMVEG